MCYVPCLFTQREKTYLLVVVVSTSLESDPDDSEPEEPDDWEPEDPDDDPQLTTKASAMMAAMMKTRRAMTQQFVA